MYGDSVRELDNGVGTILKSLIALNIDSNTFVLFSSDNGAPLSDNNDGTRHGEEKKETKKQSMLQIHLHIKPSHRAT